MGFFLNTADALTRVALEHFTVPTTFGSFLVTGMQSKYYIEDGFLTSFATGDYTLHPFEYTNPVLHKILYKRARKLKASFTGERDTVTVFKPSSLKWRGIKRNTIFSGEDISGLLLPRFVGFFPLEDEEKFVKVSRRAYDFLKWIVEAEETGQLEQTTYEIEIESSSDSWAGLFDPENIVDVSNFSVSPSLMLEIGGPILWGDGKYYMYGYFDLRIDSVVQLVTRSNSQSPYKAGEIEVDIAGESLITSISSAQPQEIPQPSTSSFFNLVTKSEFDINFEVDETF